MSWARGMGLTTGDRPPLLSRPFSRPFPAHWAALPRLAPRICDRLGAPILPILAPLAGMPDWGLRASFLLCSAFFAVPRNT